MSVRIITLSENTAHIGNFIGEEGLSILVETDDARVLLDAGKGFSTTYNADAHGIDLGTVDRIVLSHGHHDHTGGLRGVLRRMRKQVEVVAHPAVWQAKYARRKGMPDRYVGIPFQQTALESLGAEFVLTAQPVQINPSISTTGQVSMVTDFEEIDKGLFVKEESTWHPDAVLDDLALIVRTHRGLVVVTGCAHRGIINTLYHARQITGVDHVHAVIGGSHLMNTSEERLWRTIAAFKEMGVEKLGLCHCTGLPAAAALFHEFGEAFFFNKAGMVTMIE